MSNVSQGAYAPLPQSISDSDSEKEEVLKQRASHMEEKKLQNGYNRPTHTEIPEVKKVTPAMSAKRKVCFVFSIVACFFTVIVFLWVLPCSESYTCPVRISNWEIQHEGIELSGKMNVVKSAFKNILNLALLFKRDIRFTKNENGIISLLGNNGAVAWFINQPITPGDLNCYLLDVNDDGINDCLIISEYGLEAVDPVSGNNFWYAHNHTQGKPIAGLDLPIILQDLNRDNVREILTTYTLNGECKVLIISGKTGTLMGDISIKTCDDVHIIESNTTSLTYSRKYKNRVYYHQVTIDDLIAKVFDRLDVLDPPIYSKLPQVELGYPLEGHRLNVDNLGACPISNRLLCSVKITLIDEKKQRNLFSWTYANAYGFKPALFSFKRTRASLKGHYNGYIVKLWQWNDSKITKHAVYVDNKIVSPNTTVKINSITERTLLVTFNSTNFHVVNASLTNITQLCLQNNPHDFSNCQPSTSNQVNSLLISDLDMDDSLEFISYSSTFENRNELDDNWLLVSTVKVIRLEAELPKLFEVTKSMV